jgi:hypothetical protein
MRALWIFLALLCWSAPALAVERVAIVVGANQAPPGRSLLRYAHDDARAVAQVLTQVGDFAPADVEVLLEPTPERVLAAVDAQLARLGSATESMVLFYYSGHSDSDSLYPSGQPLSLSALRQRLDDPRVTVRLGVIDSCRGGAWTGAKGLHETAIFDVSQVSALRNVGSVLIASSSGLEDAHESETLRGSFFTHHFNAGLRGAADRNSDSTVSVVEAFEYAKALTIRDTALIASAPQHPSFNMNLQGRQDLPLSNLQRGESWMALAQSAGPLEVVHLQSGLVIIELESGERAVRVAVPPGRYLVRRRVGSQTFAKQYDVRASDVTRVAEADLELVGSSLLLAKGTDSKPWRMGYYSFGGLGAHQGLSYAFSEVQHGRIAPPGTNLLGFTGFGITNGGLNIEVSVPGRFAWRLGSDTAVEWVPWFGLPWYATPNAAGDLRFLVGVGAGLDVWARVNGSTRLGLNLGLTTFDDSHADDTLRAWAAVGHSSRLDNRWSINLGLGYAQSLLTGDPAIGESGAVEDGGQVRVGSVLTNGILPLPLVGYQVSDALSLGLSAQVGYRLPDGAVDLEMTLGWTWRFEMVDIFVH